MVSALSPQQFGQSPNFGQQLLGAIAQGQNIQANQQAMRAGEQSMALQQQQANQQTSEIDYRNNVRKLTVLRNLAANARKLPENQRKQFVMNSAVALESLGYTPEQIAQQPLDDRSLDAYVAQLNSAIPQSSQNQYRKESVSTSTGLQVFDPVTGTYTAAKDERGNPLTAAQYDVSLQQDISGARRRGDIEVRSELEPQLQAEIETQKQRAKQAEIQRADAIKTGNKYGSLLAGFDEAKAIIPLSTGSTLGSLKDSAGRVVGFSSDAAQNSARLRALAAWLVTQVPKPGGAVSDADLEQFKKAVGQIDDNTPPEERLAAVDTAMKLIERWSPDINQGGSGSGANTPGINSEVKAINWNDLP